MLLRKLGTSVCLKMFSFDICFSIIMGQIYKHFVNKKTFLQLFLKKNPNLIKDWDFPN